MVQVVHLAPGKQPTEAERFILIERCSPVAGLRLRTVGRYRGQGARSVSHN